MFALILTISAMAFIASIQMINPYQMAGGGSEAVILRSVAERRIVKRSVISWVLLQLIFVFQEQPASWFPGDDGIFLSAQVMALVVFLVSGLLEKDVVAGKMERGVFAVTQFLRVAAVLVISVSWLVNLY